MNLASSNPDDDDMVYTEERLKRALDVFRASEPYRKRRGLPGSNLGAFIESRSKQYETRSGNLSFAVRTIVTGTWNDKDESDDYNPRKKKTVVKAQKGTQNASKRKQCDVTERERNKAPKRNKFSYTSGRQNGLSLEVTFKFKSDAARAKIAELFQVPVLAAELNKDGNYMGDCNRGDNCQHLLFPPSQVSSLPPRKLSAQTFEHDELDVQFGGSTKPVMQNKPDHHDLPTASESDPIIIEDSDDSRTDYGDHRDLRTAFEPDPIIIADSDDSRTDYGDLLDNTKPHDLASQKRIIKTNWAHPIDYHCKPEACNFCQDFRYSFFGCGAVEIEVIQLEPGVYEEMGGGHREKGMTPTQICLNCSLERIAIAKCPGHEVLRIDGCVEEEFDYRSFLSHVSAGHHPQHPPCSICINPAFHACATRQKEDPFGLEITGEEANGCGLLLCTDCARVVASYGLNLDHLEGVAGSSKMLRADRDFLLPGSDLWQAWRK